MLALYAPYNDRWLLLTKDDPRIKSDDLYHWDDDIKSAFLSLDEISEAILYFDINCEGLVVVPVGTNGEGTFPAYVGDFTESYGYHWTMAHEYMNRG